MQRRNVIILGCILVTLALFMAVHVLWLHFGVQPTETRLMWKRILIGASAISAALSALCFYKGRK